MSIPDHVVVQVDGRYGVPIGTWSGPSGRGNTILFAKAHQTTSVIGEPLPATEPGLTLEWVGVGGVLSPEAAAAFETPRIFVVRTCCGWDWVSTREEFMESRLRGDCVMFHTPAHSLHMKQIFEPESLQKAAEDAWTQVEAHLAL